MNINKSKLLNEIKLYTSYIEKGRISWRYYQAIANAYLYLDNINDYLKNTNKAIELLFEHIETFSDDHFAKYDFLLLNCSYLWFSQNENYKLIAEKLKNYYIKDIKLGRNSDIIYYRLAQVYFMLEDYNNSANFLKFLREGYDKVSLISKAIINNDIASLETMKFKIEKLSKKQYIGTGDSGVDIYLWYYYEVCLKYLGLPNKIDEIYRFKHDIKSELPVKKICEDDSIKKCSVELIQPAKEILIMINEKLLYKIIENCFNKLQLTESHRSKSTCYEQLAKSYLYLNNTEMFCINMNKSIEHLLLSMKSRPEDDLHNIYNEKRLIYVSMWRVQDDISDIAEEIRNYYSAEMNKYDNSDKEKIIIALTYFAQNQYQKSIDIFEQINNFDIIPYAYPIAKAIVSNNMKELENIKDEIIKLYSKKLPIGTDTPRGFGVWDYYEICLKYLGLPNKIDEIYNFKHGIKTDKTVQNNEDIEIKEWALTLIQSTEIYSQIHISENWEKLNCLKPASESTNIILETEDFKNISQYIADKKIEVDGEYWDSEEERWKISAIAEEYSPSSDITDTNSVEMYLKDINIKETKKSYLETNHFLNIEHKFIIRTTKDKAEELCAYLSDEYFDKYFELEEITEEIKGKIPSDIELVQFIPYVKFDTDYIALLYIE